MPRPHSRPAGPGDRLPALARSAVGKGGRRALVLAALGALVLALGLGPADRARAEDEPATVAPKIYRWVDDEGITHYTTDLGRVPRALRGGFATRAVDRTLPEEERALATEAAAASVAASAARKDPVPVPTGDDRWVQEDRPPDVDVIVEEFDAGSDASLGPDGDFLRPTLTNEEAAALRERMEDLDLRIAELSAEIAADEDSIKEMISDPASAEAIDSGREEGFIEITRRLPDRLSELRTLREERAALEGQL